MKAGELLVFLKIIKSKESYFTQYIRLGKIFILFCILLSFFGAARYNTTTGNENSVLVSTPAEWKPYLNTKTDEFWTEGNHKPDAGFLIFAKNPTVENAKFWLLRNEIKAQQLNKMLTLVEEAQRELVKNGMMEDRYGMVKGENGILSKISKKISFDNIFGSKNKSENSDIGSVQMYFLYSPFCGYCKKMAEVLRGFPQVQPLQVDSSPLKHWDGLRPSSYASKETLSTYVKGGSVPVLLLYNHKNKNMQILRGVQTTEAIMISASNLFKVKGWLK